MCGGGVAVTRSDPSGAPGYHYIALAGGCFFGGMKETMVGRENDYKAPAWVKPEIQIREHKGATAEVQS